MKVLCILFGSATPRTCLVYLQAARTKGIKEKVIGRTQQSQCTMLKKSKKRLIQSY